MGQWQPTENQLLNLNSVYKGNTMSESVSSLHASLGVGLRIYIRQLLRCYIYLVSHAVYVHTLHGDVCYLGHGSLGVWSLAWEQTAGWTSHPAVTDGADRGSSQHTHTYLPLAALPLRTATTYNEYTYVYLDAGTRVLKQQTETHTHTHTHPTRNLVSFL